MLFPPQAYRKTVNTHRKGTRLQQPLASEVLPGTIYFVTNEGVKEISDGNAWSSYSGPGSRTSNLVNYSFSAAQISPPGTNQVRFNAGYPYTAVTHLFIDDITADGQDIRVGLLRIPPGSIIYVQDKNDDSQFGSFTTQTFPIDHTSWVDIPVVHRAHGSSIGGGQLVLMQTTWGPINSAVFTPGSVIFAGATGLLAEDNPHLFWDDTADLLSASRYQGDGALITNLDAGNLASGTIPNGRFPATLPPVSGIDLTNLNASQLVIGTVPDGRFPAVLPAVSGVNLTNLDASDLATGTVPDARLSVNVLKHTGGYPGGLTNFLRADGTFSLPSNVTPSAHAPTHNTGGTDPLTALDATIITTGILPDARLSANVLKFTGGYPGSAVNFLRADGTFNVPSPTAGVRIGTVSSTGTVNDLAVNNFDVVYLTNPTLLTITGMVAGTPGQIITLMAKGTAPSLVNFLANNVGSAVGNRLVNVILNSPTPIISRGSITYQYDAVSAVWRMINHHMGGVLVSTFNASEFTTDGAGSWVVDAGDISLDQFTIIDKVMIWNAIYFQTSLTGATVAGLRKLLPNGYTCTGITQIIVPGVDNGTSLLVSTSGITNAQVAFFKFPFANWALSTNNTSILLNFSLVLI